MAMFRTTEENFFNNLPGNYSDNLLQEYYEGNELAFKANLKHFSYNLNSTQKKYVADLGISLSPIQTETHPHPVSKTIENWIIYKCLPGLLAGTKNLVMMSIKETKAKYVFDRVRNDIVEGITINKIFEVKDVTRYHKQSIIHHGHLNFQGFLRDVKRRLGHKGPESTFFFHDELHHWSVDNFKDFLVAIEPECVIFTSVYPVELLNGVEHSMNSVAYSFKVEGDNIFFFPDGKGSEPYIQSRGNSWPFTTSKIKINYKRSNFGSGRIVSRASTVGQTTYTLSKVNSYGAHHIFVCTKGDLSTESVRFFRDFDIADPKIFKDLFEANGRFVSCKPIMRKWMLEKIVSYLVCLKKPDVESALAKLRQLSDFELSISEINVVSMVSQMLTKYGISDDISLLDFLKHPLTSTVGQIGIGGTIKYLINDQDFALRILVDKMLTSDLSFEVKVSTKVLSFDVNLDGKNVNAYSVCKSGVAAALSNDVRRIIIDGNPRSKKNQGETKVSNCSSSNSGDNIKFDSASPKPTLESNNGNMDGEDKVDGAIEEEVLEPEKVSSCSNAEKVIERNFSEVASGNRQNDCFLTTIAAELNVDKAKLITSVMLDLRDLDGGADTLRKILSDIALTLFDIEVICKVKHWRVYIHLGSELIKVNDDQDLRVINVGGRPGHIYRLPKEDEGGKALFELIKKAQESTYGVSCHPSDISLGEANRVNVLIKAFNSMNFGALIDRAKMNQGKVIKKEVLDWHKQGEEVVSTILSKVNVSLVPFLGFAGSGKTHALLDVLVDANMPGSFLFISSRKEIVDQIKHRLKDRREEERTSIEGCFKTFEAALLMERLPKLVILDECALLPPGYSSLLAVKVFLSQFGPNLDFKCSFHEFIKQLSRLEKVEFQIAYTGDVLQSSFYSDSFMPLNGLPNELVFLNSKMNKSEIPYLFGTRRFGEPSSNFIDLPFYGSGSSDILLLNGLEKLNLDAYKKQIDEKRLVTLVASHADKRYISNKYMHSLTFGESQGATFDYVILYLTPDFLKVSLESCMVAMTRHRKGLFIVLEEDFHTDFQSPRVASKEVLGVLSKNFEFLNRFISKNIHSFKVIDSPAFGHDFEIKLAGDPFLKAEMTLLKKDEVVPIEINEPILPRTNLKVHLPIAEEGILTREISEKMRAREVREFPGFGRGVSEQFKESFGKFEKNKSSQAWAAEAIFPRHKNSDSNTFWAACKKRLVFSNPRANIESLRRNRSVGVEMLKVFLKHVNLDNTLDPELWQRSVAEFEEKKISKDANTLANHHIRSLKDWKDNEIFLFIKNQLCTKSEKMFTEAKAGQTLACFSHSLLIKFAPLSRYIEGKVSKALDDRFYIHQKKNFDVLNSWVKDRGFDGLCTESDYEAFDRSQDSMTLAFEIELMKYLGIDSALISDYIWLKCHLDCKLGTLAIMRFTGEFGTFLFNTLTNMVFTFMRYDIKKDVSICFAGDDMCANRALRRKSDYDHILSCMSLKAKVQVTDRPMFCGWLLSKHGIIKSPRLIEARLRVAEEKGVLPSVLDSYFLEYSYAFLMGDHLCEVLDDENLGYHYSLTRFFVKNKNKLKGESRKILESSKQGDDMVFGELSFGSARAGFNFGKLSQPILGIDKKVCQLFQSQDSYEKYPSQKIHYTSTPYTPGISIAILTGLESLRMGKSEDFRAASQYQQLGHQAFLHQTFNASMRRKLSMSDQKATSIASYILEACSSQSLAYLSCVSQLGVGSFILMKGLAERIRLVRPALASIFPGDRLISYMPLITQSQLAIQTWIRQVGSFLNLRVLKCWKVLLPSMLMSGLSTVSQIRSTLSQLGQRLGSWLVRKFKERKGWWKWMREILTRCLKTAKILLFELSKSVWSLAGVFGEMTLFLILRFIVASYLLGVWWSEVFLSKGFVDATEDFLLKLVDQVLVRTLKEMSIQAERVRNILGQLQESLIKKLREVFSEESQVLENQEEMSAMKILHSIIREGIERQLWDMIDPQNALGLTPEGAAELDQVQKTRKRAILGHYLDYLVGNVAIMGSSKETQYPPFSLNIPLPSLTGYEWPNGFHPDMNLKAFVDRIEAWAKEHENEWVRNSTRRQLFEPLAIHALHFLQMDPSNHVTNIARKRAYQCKNAPEVAFDFCSGLPRDVINDRRAQVISALNASLFRTEGQRGVFEAKGFVEMNFDG